MKIYMAAFYHSRMMLDTTRSYHMEVCRLARHYPYMLESFHYANQRMIDKIHDNKHRIFLDSGAYSAMTQGAEIDLKDYARFVKDHSDIIEVASNLDVIGRGEKAAAGTYRNQKILEDLGVKVIPVHHVRDPDHWLPKYLEEGYQFIALGGMVPENTPTLRKWLDRMWHTYLTNPDGTPKVKVHGFGLTTLDLMFRYPWWSVDSTSWVMTAQFGSIFLDLPQPDGTILDKKVDFSHISGKRYNNDSWHFATLPPNHKRTVLDRLKELEATRYREPDLEARLKEETGWEHGFNVKSFAESYGWRDVANIAYFGRASERRVDRYEHKQDTLETLGLL